MARLTLLTGMMALCAQPLSTTFLQPPVAARTTSPLKKPQPTLVATPTPVPTPTPQPVVVWQDNPQHCDQDSQWIAADSPFACIDKPKPAPAPSAVTVAVRPVVASFGGSHQDWMASAGIPSSEWGCATEIINRESGFNVHATNSSSGAYGIPQSLPAGKLASAGADWQDNPVTQLRWMLSYVNSRYGGFCGAWSFWSKNHWY